MNALQRLTGAMNLLVRTIVESAWLGVLVGRWMTVITYTGRRSGRTVSIPVGYARDGDDLVIAVDMPERKTWWRNFQGDGQLITVRLEGADRPGRAVARRDQAGEVTVAVRLDPADQPDATP